MMGSTGSVDEEEGTNLLLQIFAKGLGQIGGKLVPGLIEALKEDLTVDGRCWLGRV